MHMFTANYNNTGVEQQIMDLEWEKTNAVEEKWETTSLTQKIQTFILSGYHYYYYYHDDDL